jgi:hypothetical protein
MIAGIRAKISPVVSTLTPKDRKTPCPILVLMEEEFVIVQSSINQIGLYPEHTPRPSATLEWDISHF